MGSSLNSTFKVLNKFALIDRNELEEFIESSQSSKGSRDMMADNVDVIRIHSVVQDFCIDSLKGRGEYPKWLIRAVLLFCCSYETADNLIKNKNNAALVEDYRLYEIHGRKLLEHVQRSERKYAQLTEVRFRLENKLKEIKEEIERRTPESSQEILYGRPDAFQTSVFDRTSSSSDTGPETPRHSNSQEWGLSAWGMELTKEQHESPISLTHELPFRQVKQERSNELSGYPRLSTEDAGYASGGDIGIPSDQKVIKGRDQREENSGSDALWQTVQGRRARSRAPRMDPHRTITRRERNRYHDRAGAWRAINAAVPDPRVSHDIAQGQLQNSMNHPVSRGRMSGRSSAEVALSTISKESPPPPRGGGIIQDRRRASARSKPDEGRGRMRIGNASYAAAVSGEERYTALRQIPLRTASASVQPQPLVINDQRLSLGPEHRALSPSSPAVSALHAFSPSSTKASLPSHARTASNPVNSSRATASPRFAYQLPYPSSNTSLALEYLSSEANLGSKENVPSSPRKRGLPHDYSQFHSQQYGPYQHHRRGSSIFARHAPGEQDAMPLSASGWDGAGLATGYTSQPMSRDPSGQSAASHASISRLKLQYGEGRRSSLANTEPVPDLSNFSPHIGPTSYQLYNSEHNPQTYEDHHLGSPLLDMPALPTDANWGSLSESYIPSAHLNHSLQGTRDVTSSHSDSNLPWLPRPYAYASFDPEAAIFEPRSSQIRLSSFHTADEGSQGPRYAHSDGEVASASSGGVLIAGRMINFGDFPEPVDVHEARERTEELRKELGG